MRIDFDTLQLVGIDSFDKFIEAQMLSFLCLDLATENKDCNIPMKQVYKMCKDHPYVIDFMDLNGIVLKEISKQEKKQIFYYIGIALQKSLLAHQYEKVTEYVKLFDEGIKNDKLHTR